MKFGKMKLTETDEALLKAAANAAMLYATIKSITVVDNDDSPSYITHEVHAVGYVVSNLTKVTHQYKQDSDEGEWVEW